MITDFVKKLKMPIIWTIQYLFVLWVIFHILFNFDIFNGTHWIRVSGAHLHGFGGFTFTLLALSAIPLYIATTAIIIRNQKPLITLPVPKFISAIKNKFVTKPTEPIKTTETTEPEQTESINEANVITNELPSSPTEMRGFILRAMSHPNRLSTPICNVCSTTPNVYPSEPAETPSAPDNDMPLPPDFDFESVADKSSTFGAPIFQDINLYDENESVDNTEDTESAEHTDNIVTEHLTKTNREFNVLDNGLILTNDMIIAVHTDSEFWIMDEPTWFAAGQTRESPIPELLERAKKHHVEPVLYLGATNIMKFDKKRAEWEKSGIRVLTDITEL